MDGLLQQGAAAASPMPQEQAPMPQGQAPMGQEQMSPEDDPMTLPGAEPANEEEQAEYDRAMGAVAEIVYNNDKSHESIMKMVQEVGAAESPLAGVVKASLVVISEVDKQIDINEAVVINMSDDVFLMISELANQAFGFDLSEKEVKQGITSVAELLLQMYGMTEQDFMDVAGGLDEGQATELMGYLEGIQ